MIITEIIIYPFQISIENPQQSFEQMISAQIRKANVLLKKKDYDASIKEYDLAQKMKTNEEIFLNIVVASLLGYNHYCLMEYEQAELWYNKALQQNPCDSTTLSRRATLFMKIKQYKKAAADIVKLSEIEPQSIRIAALVMQLKQKSFDSWKQVNQIDPFKRTQETQVDIDQEEALNFYNVKKIDRFSTKTETKTTKRSSQINFGNDQRIEYQQFQNSAEDSKIVQEVTKEKLQLQQLELNSVQSSEPSDLRFLPSKYTKKPKKSILKCSIAYFIPQSIPQDSIIENIKSSPPIDVMKVKDIDGKAIESTRSIRFSVMRNSQVLKPNPKGKPRKSFNNTSKVTPHRRTQSGRFSFGELKNLEGKVLQKKPSFKDKQNSSGDESDEYNIFGNKDPSQLNQELLRIKSYVTPVQTNSTFGQHILKPKKSILKAKNQSMIKQKSIVQPSKKSVLFK